MSYLIRRVLTKPRLILDEMCRLCGKFASYLRRVLCKTRLIFPRINGSNVSAVLFYFSSYLLCVVFSPLVIKWFWLREVSSLKFISFIDVG